MLPWQDDEWAAPGRPPPLEARVVIFHLLRILIYSSRSPQRRSDTPPLPPPPPAQQSSYRDTKDILFQEVLKAALIRPFQPGAVLNGISVSMLPLKPEQTPTCFSRRFRIDFLNFRHKMCPFFLIQSYQSIL